MGRAPCCDKANVKRGSWSPEEDATLKNYLEKNGTGGNWIALPQKAGLKRCGKSCRLRWLNYLRPHIRLGGFTEEEDKIICTLYTTIGSRWSLIAAQLSGRTDNDVKNHWNTKLKKKVLAGNINATSNASCGHFSSFSSQPKIESFVFDNMNSACSEPRLLNLDTKPTPIALSMPMESGFSSDSGGSVSKSSSLPYSKQVSTSASLVERNDHIKWFEFEQAEDDASLLDLGYDDLLNEFAY